MEEDENDNHLAPITDVSLVLDGTKKPFKVIAHSFRFKQKEENGQPFGHPILKAFVLTLASKGSSKLFGWAVNKTKTYKGSLDFYSNGSLIDQIEFEKAYCVEYSQSGDYSQNGGVSRITETIMITPKSFEWQKEKFKQSA